MTNIATKLSNSRRSPLATPSAVNFQFMATGLASLSTAEEYDVMTSPLVWFPARSLKVVGRLLVVISPNNCLNFDVIRIHNEFVHHCQTVLLLMSWRCVDSLRQLPMRCSTLSIYFPRAYLEGAKPDPLKYVQIYRDVNNTCENYRQYQ